MELFKDVRDLIPQEQVPREQAEVSMGPYGINSINGSSTNFSYASQPINMDTFDNPSEILSSLKILLCLIKWTPGGNGKNFYKRLCKSMVDIF
ncbi:hypothetical protein F8M41_000183 [Gigaspora margarita]|uniref:Uncharacterized protein n=1 Tax=Gigaspora margarita TaxID=4874 RepID=A0A8H3XI40_GIGMA|nr:hypothetical protein F8M41_000183 [Gigaspora margarita]